jgi:hypothetical protein
MIQRNARPFTMTPVRAVLSIAAFAAAWWFSLYCAAAFWLPSGSAQAPGHDYIPSLVAFSGRMALWGALIRLPIGVVAIILALARPDIDAPRAEAEVNFRVWALGAMSQLAVALWLAPVIAADSLILRGTVARALLGAFSGLMAGSVACGVMFKICRRPHSSINRPTESTPSKAAPTVRRRRRR